MAGSLRRTTVRFGKDEKGVTLVEYGIALFLAVSVGAAGLMGLGGKVEDKINAACDTLDPSCVP